MSTNRQPDSKPTVRENGIFRGAISNRWWSPHVSAIFVISPVQMAGNIVALRVLSARTHNCINAPLVSVARVQDRGLLERFVLSDTISRAVATKGSMIRVETNSIVERMIPALLDTGFVEGPDAYVRFSFPNSLSREQVLSRISSASPELIGEFQSMDYLDLEHHCSPVNLEGSVESILVPIRPAYAMGLFDVHQARQDLFGGDTNVLFRWENVYYRRATHTRLIREPGRILWYVSTPEKAVVAISHLDSVQVDTPKNLFRTFKRFGILAWKEIYKMCDGDISKDLMAMKFSHSFLFLQPVSLDELVDIYRDHGRHLVLQSPSKVSAEISRIIMTRGFGV